MITRERLIACQAAHDQLDADLVTACRIHREEIQELFTKLRMISNLPQDNRLKAELLRKLPDDALVYACQTFAFSNLFRILIVLEGEKL